MLGSKATEISLEKIERKLKKLKKNPELFITDMLFKHQSQLKKYVPIMANGSNKFTIVSAVYNVSCYLDDYFESIINQTLNFKKHIYIICVDDGSTDNSADIIKKWQKKYPKNIKYIYKENGGQASARNLGIDYIETDWVTFTDPDDFLHPDYFKKMDDAIESTKAHILAANLYFYMEQEKVSKDTHPLRKKFHEKETLVTIENIGESLQLHASSTFFKVKYIKENNIKFNSKIKPSFEDCKFLTDYLLTSPKAAQIKFVKDSVYMYRKRESGDSTLDGAWGKIGQYLDVFENGVLPMFEGYQAKLGIVPQYIQNIGLYHLSWYFKRLINNDDKLNLLTLEQRVKFRDLVHKCFNYIDSDTILKFNLSGLWFFHKVGFLGLFKQEEPKFQIAYIENVDIGKKQILINYYFYKDHLISYKLAGMDKVPAFEKNVTYNFNEEKFVCEKRAWIQYVNENDLLNIEYNNENIRITLDGKQYHKGVKVEEIIEKFKPSKKYSSNKCWLLIDRDTQADDNAEHLYRFIMNNYPKQEIVFALAKDSSDWCRLEREGFNLVSFGTVQFELALRSSSKIISSHIDNYIFNYFGDYYEFSKKFIFLQHGVIKDDLSAWINTKKGISTFITSSQAEYNSIISDQSHYKLTEKEVVLTGLPRHDSLLKDNKHGTKKILIMPTWRNNVVGKIKGNNGERLFNNDFYQTEYIRCWQNFIKNYQFKKLLNENGYQAIFYPHPLIKPYLKNLDLPDYIDVIENLTSIQNIFKEAEFLITDYSSVAFEFAYLNKQVLYYQFDYDEVFSGNHTYAKGYFDYEKNGFGPVAYCETDLLKELEGILKQNAIPLPIYSERISSTFKYRDGNNCQRIYDHICTLDSTDDEFTSVKNLKKYAEIALIHNNFLLACSRYEEYLKYNKNDQASQKVLGNIYLRLKKWGDLEKLLEITYEPIWDIELNFYKKNWEYVANFLLNRKDLGDEDITKLIFSLFKLRKFNKLKNLYEKMHDSLSVVNNQIVLILLTYINSDWELLFERIESLKLLLNDEQKDIISEYDIDIFLVIALQHIGEFDKARVLIHSIKNKGDNPMYLLEKAHIHFYDKKYPEALYFFNKLADIKYLNYLSEDDLEKYAKVLQVQNKWELLKGKLIKWMERFPQNILFLNIYCDALFNLKLWGDLVNTLEFNDICTLNVRFRYLLMYSNYRLGRIDEALSLLIEPDINFGYDYWILALELYIQLDDALQAKKVVKKMYAIFPDKVDEIKFTYNSIQTMLV